MYAKILKPLNPYSLPQLSGWASAMTLQWALGPVPSVSPMRPVPPSKDTYRRCKLKREVTGLPHGEAPLTSILEGNSSHHLNMKYGKSSPSSNSVRAFDSTIFKRLLHTVSLKANSLPWVHKLSLSEDQVKALIVLSKKSHLHKANIFLSLPGIDFYEPP